MGDFQAPVVIDIGTRVWRAGLVDTTPFEIDLQKKDSNNKLLYKKMMHRSVITNHDNIVPLWEEIFSRCTNDNKEERKSHPVLLCEATLNPRPARDTLAQILFEQCQIPAIYVMTHGEAALYGAGRTTGIGVCSGEGVTQIVSVKDGLVLPSAVQRLDLGGQDITHHLFRMLLDHHEYTKQQRRLSRMTMQPLNLQAPALGTSNSAPEGEEELVFHFKTPEDDILYWIKERHCYVSQDYFKDISTTGKQEKKKELVLPDGKLVHLGHELFEGAEVMFQPNLISVDYPGLPEAIVKAVSKCEPGLRRELYDNIVVAGGNTMFPGFVPRLQKEVETLAQAKDEGAQVTVEDSPNKMDLVWLGGSALASQSSFQQMWVTAAEFEEQGPDYIQRKCFRSL